MRRPSPARLLSSIPPPPCRAPRCLRARPWGNLGPAGLLASLIVLSLLLAATLTGTGWAASPPDVPPGMEEVAGVLAELGIIRGWDGRFWPDEMFTREQLAAVSVRLAGLDHMAATAQGQHAAMYVDAPPPDSWSSGYLVAAYEGGIMRGWRQEDGARVFAATSTVTFDETITIALRVLGYETEAMKSSWPGAYRDKALALGLITPAVYHASGEAATRGQIAEIVGAAVLHVPTTDGSYLFPEVAGGSESPAVAPPAASPPPPAPPPPAEPEVSPHDTYLNDYVQEIITTYKGSYPYLLNNDYANYNGVTQNLYYQGRLLARTHPSGNRASHCVGITFEVFFRAMQARNQKLGLPPSDFNGMTFDQLFDFLLTWYVANGTKATSNITVAVERYGVGIRIFNHEDARPGDFIDISRRNGTGHTAVFQSWVRGSGGSIVGVRYWSSQGSTGGIGYNTEYFDTSGMGNVYYNMVCIARVLPVHQYRPTN